MVSSVSRVTLRLTLRAVKAAKQPIPFTGALEQDEFPRGRAGDVSIRVTTNPPTLHIKDKKGDTVQQLTLDAAAPGLSFLLPKGPLLGLGEGGPQFDRKGSQDQMRNGQ